jgi:O-antigen/teichoic acid export membrane protein
MKLSQKIALNTIAQILGRVFSSSTTLIMTMLTLRYFGVEDFGRLTAIMVYNAYFFLFADFGFNAMVVREAARNKNQAAAYFSSLFSLRFFISLGLMAISLLILMFLPFPFNQPIIRWGVLIGSTAILANSVLTSANAVFQFHLRYDRSTMAIGLGCILNLVLVGFFLKLGYSLLSLVVAGTAGSIVIGLAALILAKKQLPQLQLMIDLSIYKKFFWLTLPLGLTLILNLAYFKIDKFLIPVLRSLEELGLYETAYKVFDFSLVFPIFFMNAVYPAMAKVVDDKIQYQRVFEKALKVLFLTSFLGLAMGWLVAPLVIKFIAGQDLPESTLVLRILFFSFPPF